jgi:lysophospholipase L1-like esterase
MANAPKIVGTDTLRSAYPKLNSAIDNANEALSTANTAKSTANAAVSTANAAENKADSVQEQFNQVVIDGDSSVEAAQARVNVEGTVFPTLKERLDDSDSLVAGVEQNVGILKQQNDIYKWQPLVTENFDDTKSMEFYFTDGTTSSNWAVNGNKIKALAAQVLGMSAFHRTAKFDDGRVSVIIENPDRTQTSTSYGGLILRAKNKTDYLAVVLYNNTSKVSLFEFVNGPGSELAYANLSGLDVTPVTGVPVSLEVEIIGETVKVYVNGKRVLTHKNSVINQYGYGMCGLMSNKVVPFEFSNFSIRRKRFDLIKPDISKIVCIGSSITFGTGATKSWVSRFDEKLADFIIGDYQVINAGVSGNMNSEMLARLPDLLTTHNPDMVVIEASINDSRKDRSVTPDQTKIDVRKMIKLVKEKGAIPLLTTGTPIDPSLNTTSRDVTSWHKIIQMNARMKQLSNEEGVRLIDNFTAFNNDLSLLDADGVHPNDTGAQMMADTAYNTITGR